MGNKKITLNGIIQNKLSLIQRIHFAKFSPFINGNKLQAFTLVELIVVIIILAILGTIVFISLQGYSAQSRDSVRISDIGNLAKVLELSMLKGEKVPMPENKIEITASGVLIAYQGEAGEKTLNVLGISNGGKDPLEETYYTYITNDELTKYQVMGFLEDGSEISYDLGLNKLVEAKDLSKRTTYIKGDELGLLLDSTTSEPVNRLGANIDIAQTTDEYKAVFTTADIVTGTGGEIFSNYYNRNKDLIQSQELAKLDENLVLYMDMETTTMSGTTIVLKDLSKYGNNGVCYNSGTIVDCGGSSGPQFVYGGIGKAMSFDGIDDWVGIPDSETLSPKTAITMIGLYKTNTLKSGRGFITKGVYNYGFTDYDYMLYTTGLLLNKPSFYIYYKNENGIGTLLGNANFNYADGQYHMLSASIDINTGIMRVYNNKYKVSEKLKTLSNIRDTNNPLKLMHGRNGFNEAELSEVRIYNRALSDVEIKTLYEATK